MSGLRAYTVPVSTVGEADREAMFRLFEHAYADVDRARFAEDLAAKDDVILLRDQDGALAGFSTLLRLVIPVDGTRHRGIYSGDTVVDPAFWGDGALGKAFLRYLLVARARHPWSQLWWFLISKGYKTYLLMANNFPEHWPRYERDTPVNVVALRDAFGVSRFGDHYDPSTGVVRHPSPLGHVRPGVADVDEALTARPRVRFFLDRNPGWRQGDELVCVAPLPWSLPFAYAWKKR